MNTTPRHEQWTHEGWGQSKLLAHVEIIESRIDQLAEAMLARGYVIVGSRDAPLDILETAIEIWERQVS